MKATRDNLFLNFVIWLFFAASGESALRWDQEPLNPTTAVEGNNVSLKWDYNLGGGTLDLVTWIQPESGLTIGRITPPSSYSVKAKFRPRFTISETEEATLIITNVSRSDAGEIDCKVEDDVGEIISTIRLIVLYLPENISLHTSANVSATLRNSFVDFWCTADGNPAPDYKLSYNSTDLGENSSGTFQVQVTESGLYVCEANNIAGIGSASVYINVVDSATADVSSSPDHVVEGHNVTLHCRVTGSLPLSIKWTKVNESNVLSNSSKLTLYNVTRPGTPDEVLQYQCTAENAYGDPASDVATIQVYYLPQNTFLNTSANVNATLKNSTVDFWCTANGNPTPQYMLYYNSTCLGNSNSGTFQIQVTESGLYFCVPYNTAGNGRATSVHINIADPATADVLSSPDHVVEGHDVTLHCRVTGSPPPSIKWTKVNDSNMLSNSSKLTLYNVTRPGTPDEVLQYKCTAKNAYGDPASDVATIQVYYPSKTTSLTVHHANTSAVILDTVVNFTCSAKASPPPHQFKLFNSDNEILNNSNGYFTLNVAQSGPYSCEAVNKVGHRQSNIVNVTVFEPAKVINISALSTEVFMGRPAFLYCAVQGYPPPHVTWYAPDGTIIQTGTFGSNVEITKIPPGPTATYQCVARNEAGWGSRTLHLSVLLQTKSDTESTGQFKIFGTFAKELADENSAEAKSLKNKVIIELFKLFDGKDKKPLSIEIILRRGSIIVDFTLFFRGLVNKTTAVGPLNEAIKNGTLGPFVVDPDSLILPTTASPCTLSTSSTEVPVKPEPHKCSWSDALVFGLSTLVVVQFVVIALLIGYICFLRKGGSARQQYETYELTEKNTENVIENRTITDEINNQSSFEDNSRRDYASLDETRRSPATEIQPQVSVYRSLSPQTRSWEVPKESLTVEKVIGKGAFGQVAKATVVNLRESRGKKTVAVKMLKVNAPASDRKDLLSELEIMKTLATHPHVIKLLGCVTTSETLMVIIEYVPYGDLLGYLRKSRGLNDTYYKDPDVKPKTNLTSQQLMKFAWQVADGMSFLSSNKIVHRDLAARNVLVGEQETCKVTDFGMARDVHQEDIYQKKTKGRLPVKWTAYEALLYGTYSTKSDVWSYGIVLFEIFTVGGCPYPKIDRRKLAELLQQGYRMPKPAHLDDELYVIMLECWKDSDHRRPSFESLKNRMRGLEKRHKLLIDMKKYDKKLYENMEDLLG